MPRFAELGDPIGAASDIRHRPERSGAPMRA
jgi:hypothetical protein